MSEQKISPVRLLRSHGARNLGPALAIGAESPKARLERRWHWVLGELAMPDDLVEAGRMLQGGLFDRAINTAKQVPEDPEVTGITHFAFRPDEYDSYSDLLAARGFKVPLSTKGLPGDVATYSSEDYPDVHLSVVHVLSSEIEPRVLTPPSANAILIARNIWPVHDTTVMLGRLLIR